MSHASYRDPDATQLEKLIDRIRREQAARSLEEARSVSVAAICRWKARDLTPRVTTPETQPMLFDSITDDRLLREVDCLLRVIARHECPPGSSRLAVSFAELNIPTIRSRAVLGFVQPKLHRLAADRLRDDSLIGRPVFAIDVDRLTPLGFEAAATSARDTAMHELAHAVALTPADGDTDRLVGFLSDSLASDSLNVLDPDSHDAGWLRRYMTLAARLDSIAPRLVPTAKIEAASERYGFGAVPTHRWIAAAKTTPDIHSGPLAEVAGRPCPAFDQLLESLPADGVSAAPVATE